MIVRSFGNVSRGMAKAIGAGLPINERVAATLKVGTARNLRAQYFDLRDASRQHAYLRTAITSIGRAIIGPGFDLVRHPLYGDEATEEQKRALWDFYNNILMLESEVQDISLKHPLSSRLYRTVGCFRLFGSAFWEVRRNKIGTPIGTSIIDGYVHPNIDGKGKFKEEAYLQYKSSGIGSYNVLKYDDVIAFMWPDFSGPAFATDVESLIDYTLSSDIYMMISIREMFKNMRTPTGIWSVDKDADPETYDSFVAEIDALYRGASNFGKSAITSQGDVSYTSIAQNMKDVPWSEGHKANRDETMATIGQFAQKIGLEQVQGNALQELRREFWEQTVLPITKIITEMMWQEIHIRIFGIKGWIPKFNPPDFTTSLQDASIAARYIQWGVMSPNEARKIINLESKDNLDYHLMPSNMIPVGEQGGPPDEVDNSEEEPKPLDEDPVPPGNEPPERPDDGKESLVTEFGEFKRYLMNDVKRGKRRSRSFKSKLIPRNIVEVVEEIVDDGGISKDVVNASIDVAMELMKC